MWRRFVTVPAAIILAVVTACSGQGDGTSPADSPKSPGPTPPRPAAKPVLHDPPLRFGTPFELGEPRQGTHTATHDAVYFLDESEPPLRLTAVDLASRKNRWSMPLPDVTTSITLKWAAPVVTTVNGRALVVTAYEAEQPGTGTTADRELLRVLAVDARNGATVWTRDIDVQDMPEDVRTINGVEHLAANGSSVAVTTDGENDAIVTHLLDAANGNPRWHRSDLIAQKVDGDVLIGLTQRRGGLTKERFIIALSTANGARLWSGGDRVSGTTVDALGPGLVSFRVADDRFRDYGTGTLLVPTRTGKPMVSLDGGYFCHDDWQSTVVCGTTDFYQHDTHVVGLERSSGKRLWEIADGAGGRIAPEISTARRGAVYGSVPRTLQRPSEPVILDARTGRDKVTGLRFVPDDVVPGYAIASDGLTLMAYPATG